MPCYLVQARPRKGKLEELKTRLLLGEIRTMRPFGTALDESLRGARVREDGLLVWEEQDYCVPPLAMERAAVLDDYFSEMVVEPVQKGQCWKQIAGLPYLWSLS